MNAPLSPSRLSARSASPLRAFTVLELIAVFVVLALVSVVTIPAYNTFVDSSHDAAAAEVVREVLSQSQSIAASKGRDTYTVADIERAVGSLPSDTWDASGATPGVSAAAAQGSVSPVEFKAAAQSNGNVTNPSVTVPSSVDEGDVMVLFLASASQNTSYSTPAGWTRLGGEVNANATAQTQAYTKVAGTADAGTTLTVAGTALAKASLDLVVYTNATEVSAHTLDFDTAMSTSRTTPAVSVPDDGSAVIGFWGDKSSANTGWELPVDVNSRSSTAGTGGGRVISAVADRLDVDAGPAGGWTATTQTATARGMLWSVVVAPTDVPAEAGGSGPTNFVTVIGEPSTAYGELSIGVPAGAESAGVSMRSRSGRCVSGTVGVRGQAEVTVSDSVSCAAPHVETTPTASTPDLDAPACPTGASVAVDDQQAELSWAAPADADLAGYDLYVDGADPPTTLASTATSHLLTGLTNGQTYTFSVVAFDASGNRSGSCALGNGTPDVNLPDPPAAPLLCSGGAPTCVEASGQVTVHWVAAPATTYQSYDLYRDGALVTSVPSSTTSYTDTGLTNGQTYSYWVIGVADTGVPSSSSNVAALTPAAAPSGPLALATPTVTANPVDRTIQVSWTASAEPEVTEYLVYLDGSQIATVPVASPRSLTISTSGGSPLQWAGLYTVTVRASDGAAGRSDPGAANALLVPAVPAPSTSLETINSIRVSWPAVSGATSYRVLDGSGNQLASVTSTSWLHTGRGAGSTSTYTVKACNASTDGDGCSDPSAPVSRTVPDVPGSPAVACPVRDATLPDDMTGCDRYRQVAVRWAAPANNGSAITRYEVRRAFAVWGAPWSGWTNVGIPPTVGGQFAARVGSSIAAGDAALGYFDAFRFANGEAFTAYQVQVRACNAVGCGGPGTVTGRPFSNDLYPNNGIYGMEQLRRGEHLQSVVNNSNTYFGLQNQSRAMLQTDGNLVLRLRARATDGTWGTFGVAWASGTATTDPSVAVGVADTESFSGLIMAASSTPLWFAGGPRCFWGPNVRAYLFHNATFAVYAETHHRRNYNTFGGNYPGGTPYDGSALAQWSWRYSYSQNTVGYTGCSSPSAINGGSAGSLPVP